ncbi:MAG: FadR/GntR family transcriptional regulator [Ruegeria sp.]
MSESLSLITLETTETEDTVAVLRDFITAGDYQPGDRLPSERNLIGRLGISRSALRKALGKLEGEGSIWRHVGKGTFIAPQGLQAGNNQLKILSQSVTPVKLMRARLSLEPALAREAAVNASEFSVARLKTARDRAANAENWDDYEAEDDAFHRAIAEASENVLLLSLFDHLNGVRRAVAWNSVVRQSVRPPRDHSSFKEHDQILAAISERNPSAAHNAMREHLSSVSTRLFGEE